MTMIRLAPTLLLLPLAILPVACDDVVETEHVNTGQACVSGSPDQPHEIAVDFQQCLSSSCDELLDASCTVTVEGNTLTIESTATIRSSGTECTADCGAVATTCTTPPLAAGTYDVVYDDHMTQLEVTEQQDTPSTCAG